MDKKRKIMIGVGVIAAVILCGIIAFCTFSENSVEDLMSGEITSDSKDKNSKKKDKNKDNNEAEDDLDAASAGSSGEDADADGAGNVGQFSYLGSTGLQLSGTSSSQSFSIKMSDLCTFSDPAGISFSQRYVLHGGSGCTMSKTFGASEAYVILYAKNGRAAGEYKCYVMSSEAQARSLEAEQREACSGSDMSAGRWGDVVYVYTPGSTLQTTIEMYAKAGVIKSATPQAYLNMPVFAGMSEYKAPAGNNHSQGTPSTPTQPTNPDQPVNPDQPETPDQPTNPDKPDTPDQPDDPDKPDDKLKDARTTKEDSYDIVMSDQCIFTDPEDLDFDTRYVLYADADSSAATGGMSMFLGTVDGVFEVCYTKNGEPAAEYKCYVLPDAETAQSKAEPLGWTAEGNVVIQLIEADSVKANIEAYASLGYISEGTTEEYLIFTLENEGYVIYKRADSEKPDPDESDPEKPGTEDPDPEKPGTGEPDPEKPGTGGSDPEKPGTGGSDPEKPPVDSPEYFDIIMSDAYTYADPQGLDFDTRYALYDPEGTFTQVSGAKKGFFEILYCKDGKAVAEYQCYVMDSEEEAKAKKAEFAESGIEAECAKDVVIVYNAGEVVQGTIEAYASYGLIDATAEGYLSFLFKQYGMTDCTEDQNPVKEAVIDAASAGTISAPAETREEAAPETPVAEAVTSEEVKEEPKEEFAPVVTTEPEEELVPEAIQEPVQESSVEETEGE